MRTLNYIKNNYIYLTFIFLFGLIIILVSSKWVDNDLFNMIATGNEWIQNGPIHENTFTVVSDSPIVVEQWLWNVLLSYVWNTFGVLGMHVLNVGIILCLYLSYIAFLKSHKQRNDATAFFAFVFVLCLEYKNLRPQGITLILLVWECYFLEKAIQQTWKWLLFLPVLTLIEINVHAPLWVLHFVLLIPYLLPDINKIRFKSGNLKNNIRNILAIIPVMILTLFINPYGYQMPLYIFRFFDKAVNSLGIKELNDITMLSTEGIIIIILILLLFSLRKRISVRTIIMCTIITVIGVSSVKQGMFIPIAYMYLLSDVEITILQGKHIERKTTRIVLTSLTLILIPISLFLGTRISANAFEDIIENHSPAIEYLNNNSISRRVYTEFNTGNILELYGYKVYIDSRPEIYLNKVDEEKTQLQEYIDLFDIPTEENYQKFFDKYEFEFAYIDKINTDVFCYLYYSDDWKLVVPQNIMKDEKTIEEYFLFERVAK